MYFWKISDWDIGFRRGLRIGYYYDREPILHNTWNLDTCGEVLTPHELAGLLRNAAAWLEENAERFK
jgi:hypothetical protein